jgi:hypothetical protein
MPDRTVRAADLFALLVLLGILALALCWGHTHWTGADQARRLARVGRVVAEVGLTDLALATEARHTRHPSQADRHAPFQSHPLALDHFPSGSIIGPPPALRNGP